ncbi:MAG: ATP-binding cassette domain-containing protein [Calditrichota bacterium]
MNDIAVAAKDLAKNYYDASGQTVHACQALSFEARRGEVFGLLGTNGAGKTTALRMLSTVLRPTGGDAHVVGHSIVHEPDRVRSTIGFLSADTGVYGRLTAREMIEYFGRLHGLTESVIATRVQQISDRLNMQDFLSRRCDKLSSGQKQRVSIARTIVHDPEVLIFDEPTSGLDILAAAQIVEFIRDSRARGRCVIFSTHVMREAEKLCDRLVILHRGQVCASGTLTELREQTGYQDLEDVFLRAIGELPS